MSPIPRSSTLVRTGLHFHVLASEETRRARHGLFRLFHGKPALLAGRKTSDRKPTMSVTAMKSIFFPCTVAEGSLSSLIELELNG